MSFLSRVKAKFKRSSGDQKSEQHKPQIPIAPFQLEQEHVYHGHTYKYYEHPPLGTDMYLAAGAQISYGISKVANASVTCRHKRAFGCLLDAIPRCCACSDQRPHEPMYLAYADGRGYVHESTRWRNYCSACSEHWIKAKGIAMPDPKDVNEGQYDEDPDDILETVDELSSKLVLQRKKVASKLGDLKGLVRVNRERGTFDCNQFNSHTPAKKSTIRTALANPSIARASLAEPHYTPVAPDLGVKVVKGVLVKTSTSTKREKPMSALEKETKLMVWSARHVCRPTAALGKHNKAKLDIQKSLKNASSGHNFPTKGESRRFSEDRTAHSKAQVGSRVLDCSCRISKRLPRTVPFSTWLKVENYQYEPEPDYCECSTSKWRLSNALALKSKAPPERYFFQYGRPMPTILNEWQRLSTPISRSNLMNSLDSRKNKAPVDFYEFIYFADRFWGPKSIWKIWTSQTPTWQIERGLPDVRSLRVYVARQLRIWDPRRLRISFTPIHKPRAWPKHLTHDDDVRLRDIGFNADNQIAIGWANSIWVRNLLPGLNFGRSFLLTVPELDSGKARIGHIRLAIAKKLRIPDGRLLRLLLNDKELSDDRKTAEQEKLHWGPVDSATNDRQLDCRITFDNLHANQEKLIQAKNEFWQSMYDEGKISRECLKRKFEEFQHPVPKSLESMLRTLHAPPGSSKEVPKLRLARQTAPDEDLSWKTPTQKRCTVCAEDKYPFEMPYWNTKRCRHAPTICSDDLNSWIASQLTTKEWDRIKCPESGCNEYFRHEDMKENASEACFALYETCETRATLSKMPDFRWCLAPGCESGQLHDVVGEGPLFICNGCKGKICVIHNKIWHEGETCEQYDYRTSGQKSKDEANATAKTIQKTTKKCPRCSASIEKNEGCDHMTCRMCQMEFCWRCFADYKNIREYGNTAHERGCRYHTLNNI